MNAFWENALSNFIADVFAGLIFSIIVAWWIGRLLSNFERAQQLKDEKKANIKKAIQYLELLNSEISFLIDQVSNSIDSSGNINNDVDLSTPLWEVLQPSGELPRLLNPDILFSVTRYYDQIKSLLSIARRVVKRHEETTVTSLFILSSEELEDVLFRRINETKKEGTGLPEKIDKEIHILKTKLDEIAK